MNYESSSTKTSSSQGGGKRCESLQFVYEGRLVNWGNGEYKGYPLSDDEWPEGLGK